MPSMVSSLTYQRNSLLTMRKNESGIGDTVRIMETRPISKRKCWRMVEVVEKAK